MTSTDAAPAPEIAGFADPEGEAPWAMQLVVCVDRDRPPTHVGACTAAAAATVALLADPRAADGGLWRPQIDRWLDGRIRKHVRRARGAAWERVQNEPGVTVSVSGAQVRAFVPCSMDDTPRDVARCQMQGLALADSVEQMIAASHVVARPAGPIVVSLSAAPVLSTGKAAAAAGHAAQLAFMKMDADRRAQWAADGYGICVELPNAARWAERIATAPVVVVDAGLTEIDPGTVTATATWA